MATVTTREGLKDYCLRRLGSPVIEINVEENQIEDRIDDAFQFYREYHYDAVEMVYLKHQFTADDITNQYISVPDAVVGVSRVLKIIFELLISMQNYWIFSSNGELKKLVELPHKITNWVGRALCVSESQGFGMS